ncbi:MAG: hypothetical protein AAFZ11_07205 [Pseudomonadota bacterium]
MSAERGPRPWPIHAFAGILCVAATVKLVRGLLDVEAQTFALQRTYPTLEWNNDLAIVLMSADTTIILIPVVAVWMFRSRIARILVTVMAIPTVWLLVQFAFLGLGVSGPLLADSGLRLLAVALLYTPAASAWLRSEGDIDVGVFR